jgi:DNA ligase-1
MPLWQPVDTAARTTRENALMATALATLVDASAQAAATSSRLAKRDAIAALLRGAAADEVEIAVAWLSGEIRQGRIGVGWSALSTLRGRASASTPSLTLREVDTALADVATTAGKGSAAARKHQLAALFARATAAEQDFLVRLLVGELRQGALEGVMLDAIAAASGLPAADVRRAAMLTGSLRETARVAMGDDGAAALARFAVALHRPVQPMLATPPTTSPRR